MNGSGRLLRAACCAGALLGTLAAGGAASGCHRATEADCKQIVDRIVELELRDQGVTDPVTLEARKSETKAKQRGQLVGGCVGKRISLSAMGCIRSAKTSSEITDKCLR